MTLTARFRVQRFIGRYRGTEENHLDLLQNQTATVVIEVFQEDGEPANLTGKKLWWTLRRTTDTAQLAQLHSAGSGIVIGTPATKGLATMTLTSTQTNVAPGEYIADCWMSETDDSDPEPTIWPTAVTVAVGVTQNLT